MMKYLNYDCPYIIYSDTSSSGSGGVIGGGVVGALLFISGTITVVVVVYVFLRWRTKSRVKRLQMGLFTM